MRFPALLQDRRLHVVLLLAGAIAVGLVGLHAAANRVAPEASTSPSAVPDGWWAFSEGYISGALRHQWKYIILDRNDPVASKASMQTLPAAFASSAWSSFERSGFNGGFQVFFDPTLDLHDNIQFVPHCLTGAIAATNDTQIRLQALPKTYGAPSVAGQATYAGHPVDVILMPGRHLQPPDYYPDGYYVYVPIGDCVVAVAYYTWKGSVGLEDFTTFVASLRIDPSLFPK